MLFHNTWEFISSTLSEDVTVVTCTKWSFWSTLNLVSISPILSTFPQVLERLLLLLQKYRIHLFFLLIKIWVEVPKCQYITRKFCFRCREMNWRRWFHRNLLYSFVFLYLVNLLIYLFYSPAAVFPPASPPSPPNPMFPLPIHFSVSVQ